MSVISSCEYCNTPKEYKWLSSVRRFCSHRCEGLSRRAVDYCIDGDITSIYLKGKFGEIVTCLIDTEDLQKCLDIDRWWCAQYSKDMKSYYVYSRSKSRPAIQMHRYLTNAPNVLMVDHLNHNTLDNRKSNLKICSNSENQLNRIKPPSTNKSGIMNVIWDKNYNGWRALICKNKKPILNKFYKNIKEAEDAVIKFRKENL